MANEVVLIADDDASVRTVLTQALMRAGYEVRACANASSLWRWITQGEGDLVITDVVMPDESGFELLPKIKAIRPDLPVMVMSARSNLLTAITATERGAYEYLPKPFDLDELLSTVKRALASRQSEAQGPSQSDKSDELPLIGRSSAMQEVFRAVARLVSSDLTVLILGESGTGKELIARAIHDFGRRKGGPFVAVNVAAIPRELIESELFGHERGAFTGANTRLLGRFEQAQGGTLFLDEIGDMPMDAQTRLLRVLQEGEFHTVGGRTQMRVDARIIAATHHNLQAQVEAGRFREDLFFRLNVVPIRLPSLRNRLDDIPDLVRHFVDKGTRQGLQRKVFTEAAIAALKTSHWPGNVRELENVVQRLMALRSQTTIEAAEVWSELSASGEARYASPGIQNLEAAIRQTVSDLRRGGEGDGDLYARVVSAAERPLLAIAMELSHGNQLKAAALLGINRNTLRKKLQQLDIR